MPDATSSELVLRPATPADAPLFSRWDAAPHVRAGISPDGRSGYGVDWRDELAASDWQQWFVAEAQGRPIGALSIQAIDREPSGYWGAADPGLRAIDIWIGEADSLGRGFGTAMMRLALARAFADPAAAAVLVDPLDVNRRAHRFYERLGFRPLGPRRFGEVDCLVLRLDRAAWRP